MSACGVAFAVATLFALGAVAFLVVAIVLFAVKGLCSYGQAVTLARVGNHITAANQRRMVDALLRYDHGRTPRPFAGVVNEDGLGLGGHIVAKHVRAVGAEIDLGFHLVEN
mgnify:CR=1 FL=1